MKNKAHYSRFGKFIQDISLHTPFVRLVLILVLLWLIFSAGLYLADRDMNGTTLHSYPDALYWGIAAFSTAGIADPPISGMAKLIGGLWIVLGSTLFFGAIVATVTGYFMRPLQRPHKQIIDTIEYNLEQLTDLTLEELDLLKETVDALIEHVEHLKARQPKE
ncbi:ion channel [Shewanella salipaludis]|uniref:Two pore domain potassium channel family protein n=1 Tax=Shewanella salipaludis TaxID=2723052 RepID=A0A972FWE0_9GAMM|nr:ion channel [Shewanella salipaludis]NMH64498.1 two pore domain potassium channel family protein [Shewanella salipaludis]